MLNAPKANATGIPVATPNPIARLVLTEVSVAAIIAPVVAPNVAPVKTDSKGPGLYPVQADAIKGKIRAKTLNFML